MVPVENRPIFVKKMLILHQIQFSAHNLFIRNNNNITFAPRLFVRSTTFNMKYAMSIEITLMSLLLQVSQTEAYIVYKLEYY